jgi:hypothetical protein
MPPSTGEMSLLAKRTKQAGKNLQVQIPQSKRGSIVEVSDQGTTPLPSASSSGPNSNGNGMNIGGQYVSLDAYTQMMLRQQLRLMPSSNTPGTGMHPAMFASMFNSGPLSAGLGGASMAAALAAATQPMTPGTGKVDAAKVIPSPGQLVSFVNFMDPQIQAMVQAGAAAVSGNITGAPVGATGSTTANTTGNQGNSNGNDATTSLTGKKTLCHFCLVCQLSMHSFVWAHVSV